jgi:hypothetical protein
MRASTPGSSILGGRPCAPRLAATQADKSKPSLGWVRLVAVGAHASSAAASGEETSLDMLTGRPPGAAQGERYANEAVSGSRFPGRLDVWRRRRMVPYGAEKPDQPDRAGQVPR